MKESPMLFSAPMVRATRADLKTKTRRVIKPQPTEQPFNIEGTDQWAPPDPRDPDAPDWSRAIRCPYGVAGDRLWGRETFYQNGAGDFIYRANYDAGSFNYDLTGWRPSIFMPRVASRLLLEIVSIGVERVQEISEADAIAEGIPFEGVAIARGNERPNPIPVFARLWDTINAKRGYPWESNCWVWVVEFKRLEAIQ